MQPSIFSSAFECPTQNANLIYSKVGSVLPTHNFYYINMPG